MGIDATKPHPLSTGHRGPTHKDLFSYAFIAIIAVFLAWAGIKGTGQIRENAKFMAAAAPALYRERCKEIGGVNSETETKLCIVGSRTIDVHSNDYLEVSKERT